MKGRLEDYRLLTGQGRYASDWSFAGQAHAVFLRADRGHAEIVAIGTGAARAHPGVLAVLTAADIAAAGYRSLPTALAFNDRFGQPLKKPHRRVLARERVRYVGECVACVVAESPLAAQDALELIEVEYRELPVVVAATGALEPGAPQLHENVPDNLYFDYGSGDEAGTEAAFKAAARVVSITLYNTRVIANPLEPRGCVGSFDSNSAHYTLVACTQGVYGMRGQLVETMGVADDKLDVVAHDVGGGFGVRFSAYPEYCAALLASKMVGRPVKWTASRSEVFLNDEQGRDVVSHGEVALDDSGRFLAMRFSFTSNMGAYLSATGPFISTRGVTNCLTGVYSVPRAWGRVQLVATNTPPVAAYRGAGRPTMSYIVERLVDQAAFELGMDPAELRRRNLVAGFPYKTANGTTYDCGDFKGVLDDALETADWAGFAARRAESVARGRLRGRGLACYVEATGAGNAPTDQVELRFDAEAGITLYAVSHSQGQGHETSFAQIVAGVLGVPVESIRLKQGDPAVRLIGNSAGASRSLYAVGSVMQLAAMEVVEKGMALASKELEAAAADIEFKQGAYGIKGTDRTIGLAALAKKYAHVQPHPLDVRSQLKIGATFPNGCHIAEVEIEPETGDAAIVRYTAVDDAGNIINPLIVEGQMHGGITQGAGQAFGELAVYDGDSGQLLSGSFMDYTMPRAGMVHGITLKEHPVPTLSNVLGAKGVGEAGVTGSLPALMNAVLDALRQAGVTHFDMPASPRRLWEAIRAAKAGNPRALSIEPHGGARRP